MKNNKPVFASRGQNDHGWIYSHILEKARTIGHGGAICSRMGPNHQFYHIISKKPN